MRRPVIGLTMDSGEKPGKYALNCDYAMSIERAGGLPLAIPYRTDHSLIPQIVDVLDGILFIGGDDLDPSLYSDEPWHEKAIRLEADRQNFELALIAEVERRRLPALGVCLGSQLMNVHRGGSLHQFLPDVQRPDAIEHRRLERERPAHAVTIDTDTTLGRAIGARDIIANTYHKQGIRTIGRGLRVVATAPDGIIEAFEDPSLPLFAAVQWHPERLHEEPEHLAVFTLLVEKARQRK